jgi:hypothetical protein
MTSNTSNYKLLFAGILAFFVIMTYDHDQLMAGVPLEWIKAIIGSLAVIYLLWFNIKKNQSGKLDRSK